MTPSDQTAPLLVGKAEAMCLLGFTSHKSALAAEQAFYRFRKRHGIQKFPGGMFSRSALCGVVAQYEKESNNGLTRLKDTP